MRVDIVKHSRNSQGFVLLLVLLVLTVCGVLLASAARRSGAAALEARGARSELQRRWGTLSCSNVCLTNAESLLDQAQTDNDAPAIEVRHAVMLGETKFDLILADEQAKLNANMLVHRRSRQNLVPSLQRLQSDCRQPLLVIPYPTPQQTGMGDEKDTTLPQLFSSYAQLLAYEHPSQLIGSESRGSSPISGITCWGSGALNLKRAVPEVLRQALGDMLTESHIATLQTFRQEKPSCTIDEILLELDLPRQRKSQMADLATDRSDCHSVWVIAGGPTRQWYRLCVRQTGDAATDVLDWSFQW